MARRAVLVPTPARLSYSDMRSRSDLEPCRLRAGCLRQLDGCKRDERHRADSNPGNCDAGDAVPGQTSSQASGLNRANDRVHVAQSRNRIANCGLLGHPGLAEVSHAVLKMVLKLAQDAAAP
jgi:hypothetical protein